MSRRKDPSYEGVPEEIERLADLRDKGVISDKDFQNLKKKLIQGADLEKQETLADFETWARQHEGEQFSTSDLAEKSGFSSQTVLKYLKTSTHFIKIKQGLYECGQNQPVKS